MKFDSNLLVQNEKMILHVYLFDLSTSQGGKKGGFKTGGKKKMGGRMGASGGGASRGAKGGKGKKR